MLEVIYQLPYTYDLRGYNIANIYIASNIALAPPLFGRDR